MQRIKTTVAVGHYDPWGQQHNKNNSRKKKQHLLEPCPKKIVCVNECSNSKVQKSNKMEPVVVGWGGGGGQGWCAWWIRQTLLVHLVNGSGILGHHVAALCP